MEQPPLPHLPSYLIPPSIDPLGHTLSRTEIHLKNVIAGCPHRAKGLQCISCDESAALEQQILDTKALLASLFSKRPMMSSLMNCAHDPITSKLPVEVAAKIFMYFMPDDISQKFSIHNRLFLPSSKSMNDANDPFTLAVVCKSWRRIIWATPQLWTSVYVNLCDRWSEAMLNKLQKWLGRSGVLPLQICVDVKSDFGSSSLHRLSPHVLPILASSTHRWRYLHLKVSPISVPSLFSNISQARILDKMKFGELYTGISGVSNLIDLRKLSFSSFGDGRFINFNWDRITHIDAHGLKSAVVFRQLLLKFPNLTNGSFSFIKAVNESDPEDHMDEDGAPAIQHLHLMTLKFWPWSLAVETVLSKIQFPALSNFVGSWSDLNFIPDFLRHSTCTLTTLDLPYEDASERTANEAQLIHVLSQIPSLRTLKLRGNKTIRSINGLFAHLSATSAIPSSHSEARFLPNLRHLAIDDLIVEWDIVLALISMHIPANVNQLVPEPQVDGDAPRERHRRIRPLRRLHINLEKNTELSYINPDIVQRLYSAVDTSSIEIRISTLSSITSSRHIYFFRNFLKMFLPSGMNTSYMY
ncbi:hypothetical protein BDN70DRAFT_876602 [Pholiota conissans]|uniref:F-box domain-containing protein n=1 Tax=Pholiota conissans TaxID=109636 RepID=A0A9P5Z713_9AGAR|nr:hypothetical protein BDN70DRAFT_876602 [Pholiota conissans]